MRTALRPNPNRSPTANSKSTPAPVGGWNARDSLADMGESEAVILDNWFPEASYVRLRGGSEEYADTQETTAVESLMIYTGLTTTEMFPVCNGKVFNASTSGTIGSADVTGLSNSRYNYENYGNSAGNFLFACNAANTPLKYDGSTWGTMSVSGSGLTASNLSFVKSYKERLFFLEKDKLWFWYLPVSTISGAMAKFDLSPFCSLGGSLIAIATWSRDAGDGADEYILFLTSEGEILVYKGTDPNSANTWALSSIFRISKPIGNRCTIRVGSDVIIVTQDGFLPLSKVLIIGRAITKEKISDKIADAVSTAAALYKNNFGWQGLFWAEGHMAIFNIPVQEGVEQHQYVVNIQTGAWARFKDLNGNCFAVFNDDLYFGANDGTVWQADVGTADGTAAIQTEALQAYNYFSRRGKQKRFTLVRPVMRTTGILSLSTRMSFDFEYNAASAPGSSSELAGALWDVALWDVATWGDGFRVNKNWKKVSGKGNAAALGLKTSTKYQEIQWLSTDYIYETGGFL